MTRHEIMDIQQFQNQPNNISKMNNNTSSASFGNSGKGNTPNKKHR